MIKWGIPDQGSTDKNRPDRTNGKFETSNRARTKQAMKQISVQIGPSGLWIPVPDLTDNKRIGFNTSNSGYQHCPPGGNGISNQISLKDFCRFLRHLSLSFIICGILVYGYG